MSTKRKNIPRLLKQWRKRKTKELGRSFTQAEAAAEIGLPVGTYIGYEQGSRGSKMNPVTYDHIIKVTALNGTMPAEATPVAEAATL